MTSEEILASAIEQWNCHLAIIAQYKAAVAELDANRQSMVTLCERVEDNNRKLERFIERVQEWLDSEEADISAADWWKYGNSENRDQ